MPYTSFLRSQEDVSRDLNLDSDNIAGDQGDWCTHEHKGKLSPKELENLKFVARMRPCNDGLECMNPDCFDGHKCQYGLSCTKKECWFSNDMHEVESTGVVKVPVDKAY